MSLDLGLGVFWIKGENSLLNVEEFRGGSGGGNWVDFSTFKIFHLRHSFVACIYVLQILQEFSQGINVGFGSV